MLSIKIQNENYTISFCFRKCVGMMQRFTCIATCRELRGLVKRSYVSSLASSLNRTYSTMPQQSLCRSLTSIYTRTAGPLGECTMHYVACITCGDKVRFSPIRNTDTTAQRARMNGSALAAMIIMASQLSASLIHSRGFGIKSTST